MRTHEEFCAEIDRRKDKLIKKKKERRRIALACIPFVACIGIFASVVILGYPASDTSPESFSPSFVLEDIEQLRVTLPAKGSIEQGMTSLTVTDPSDAERLLNFVEDNEEAFLLYNMNSWYAYSDPDSIVLPDKDVPTTIDQKHTSAINEIEIMEAEDVAETEFVIEHETVLETELDFIQPTETDAITKDNLPDIAEEACTNKAISAESIPSSTDDAEKTTLTEKGTMVAGNFMGDPNHKSEGETTLPYCPPGSTSVIDKEIYGANKYVLYTQSVEAGDMFIITVTTTDGTAIQYALDIKKHGELARELESLLMDIEK